MKLIIAEDLQIEKLVDMSVKAFASDINVGADTTDGPPDYDSVAWHRQMADEGHLYQAMEGDIIVGGAILFYNEEEQHLYIGRIFIDPIYHKKGYGIRLMQCVEQLYENVDAIFLDTPEWNIRTNSFYRKLGYKMYKQEEGFNFYKKHIY